MQGFQITFYTCLDRQHHGKPLAEWLLEFAKQQGVRGATLIAGNESFGRDGRTHAAHFFELADQPMSVTMIADAATTDKVFAALAREAVEVFYTKTAIEFGSAGGGTTR